MALIWVRMAMWTWSQGTPTSLGIKSYKYIIILHLIHILKYFYVISLLFPDILHSHQVFTSYLKTILPHSGLFQEILPDNLAVGECIEGFAISYDAKSQKQSAGHNRSPKSHDEVCFSLQTALWEDFLQSRFI